ncbi:MAG: EthD domain-containing protein, partial [Sphingomonas sp.]
IADEQTAFRMVTREITREFILIPSARHRDPISLVKIHMRRPELDRETFQHRLLHEHADLVLAQPATRELVRRYAQLHNIGSTQADPEGSKIDAVSILAFACMNDVEDYLIHDDHAAIAASEAVLAGEGSEWWTAINYSVINRLAPEVATDRDG